jgi:hypothetical protein
MTSIYVSKPCWYIWAHSRLVYHWPLVQSGPRFRSGRAGTELAGSITACRPERLADLGACDPDQALAILPDLTECAPWRRKGKDQSVIRSGYSMMLNYQALQFEERLCDG